MFIIVLVHTVKYLKLLKLDKCVYFVFLYFYNGPVIRCQPVLADPPVANFSYCDVIRVFLLVDANSFTPRENIEAKQRFNKEGIK